MQQENNTLKECLRKSDCFQLLPFELNFCHATFSVNWETSVLIRHPRLKLITSKISINIFFQLSANPTKWSNTLKQFVGNLPTNCLSVFDHFVKLALKRLSSYRVILKKNRLNWNHHQCMLSKYIPWNKTLKLEQNH